MTCMLVSLVTRLPAQDFIFKRYTAVDGLVNDVIITMMEDSHGFLWIATASGISRFDGKNFRNYGYTEGLAGLVVYIIYEDSKHRLWIGTSRGIAQLKGNRFTTFMDAGPGDKVVSMFGEYDGYGLVAFSEAGTYALNNHDRWVKVDILPPFNNRDCVEMREGDGGLYMNYREAIIFKKNNGEASVILQDTTDGRSNFCNGIIKKNGKVYAGVYNRIYELSNGQATLLIDSIPIDRFFNYAVDSSGKFWVNSSGKGLFTYEMLNGKSKKISAQEYDSNTSGYPLIDAQGNVWITSYEGLIKVARKVFDVVTPPKVTRTTKRLNIIPGCGEEVLVSDASGLHVIRDNKIERIKRPSSYKDDFSYRHDIVEGYDKDSRGFTWLITRKRKMLCWNGTQMMDYSPLLVPRSTDYIRNLTVNRINNKIFICDDSTLIYGNEQGFTAFTDRNGNRFPQTTTVLFTHNGIGIVNVFGKGVYFITRENQIIKAPSALDIIEKGNFTYFYEDDEGWVWISNAGKGLVRFRIDEKTYAVEELSVITTEDGLPSNKIVYVTFDAEGNTWVSCSNGISILRHNKINSRMWDVYQLGKEQNVMLAPPVTMISDKLKNVWLASLKDLVKIDISKLQFKKLVPDVVIESVMLNMKETNWSEYADSDFSYFQLPVGLSLDHTQNTLGIEFTGVSLYDAENLEYSYQLAPLDTGWSTPSPNKVISLVKLAPGTYSFSVKARAKGTAWSMPAVFNFNVRSPFWETWWFRLLVIVLAASVIIRIYLNRMSKIQQKADLQHQMLELEMKALKAQMNPHFIYNALNSIQSLIADDKKNEAISYIGKFSRLLRQVLDYSENNVISLDKELHALELYIQIESLRLNMKLDYTVVTGDIITENEKVPPLILQPFVENALWHGLSRREGAKQLRISITQEDHSLVCQVQDNGIGRANAASFKQDLYSSRGIEITAKRLTDFNGTNEYPVKYFDLVDDHGAAAGTRVTITIKRPFNKFNP